METRYRAKVSAYFVFEEAGTERGMRLQWLCEGKSENDVRATAKEQKDFLLEKFGNGVIARNFTVE